MENTAITLRGQRSNIWPNSANILQHTQHTQANIEGPTHAKKVQHPFVLAEKLGRGALARRGPLFLAARLDVGPFLRVLDLRNLRVCAVCAAKGWTFLPKGWTFVPQEYIPTYKGTTFRPTRELHECVA